MKRKRGKRYDVVLQDNGAVDIVEISTGARVYHLEGVKEWLDDLVELVTPKRRKENESKRAN